MILCRVAPVLQTISRQINMTTPDFCGVSVVETAAQGEWACRGGANATA
jgi:hypothetical protein